MIPKTMSLPERSGRESLAFVQRLFRDVPRRDFAVRLWDGTLWEGEPGTPPRFTLHLRHPGALRRMFWRVSQISLGEAFIYGDFDVKGDLEAAFDLAEGMLHPSLSWSEKMRCAGFLLGLPAPPRAGNARRTHLHGTLHSRRRDARAISYHYDVSNDFYRLWLDPEMVYSCAYFADAAESLESAQRRKLDYICRKLRLRPGERLLDIGCGWGSLLLHAVRNYGVDAVGITLSRAQAELARERIAAEGLAERCHVEIMDYRELDEPECFDKLVSVGMFEHVGEGRLGGYFERAFRLLRPGGVFLNHGIASTHTAQLPPGESFIDRYVFPDGELLPIATTLGTAEASGFEVRDLESLREHYALTLRHWVRRLEQAYAQACRVTDEVTCRIWRLYMAGSAQGFRVGRLNLYQALLYKPGGDSSLPLTRADWYLPA